PLLREQPRRNRLRFAALCACDSTAGRDHAERHTKGRRAGTDADHLVFTRVRGPVADALVLQRDARTEQPGALHRERGGHDNHRGRADRAPAWSRAWQGRSLCRTTFGATGRFTSDARRGATVSHHAGANWRERDATARRCRDSRASTAGRRRTWPGERYRTYACVLAESGCVLGWDVHDHQPAKRVHQNVRAAYAAEADEIALRRYEKSGPRSH